ncbi:hypothetical protein LCGC14_0394040 [marine sediment metagenome]|uniref:Bacteriophage Mu GpT domain-containing protein n=1 Tax=marine sediment metagenome TaxID=412755 RepID=A0A0F9T4F8_9ZZZZ
MAIGGAEITTKILAETLFELSPVMEDNVSKMIPLFWFLRAKDQMKEVTGARDFRERLMYGKGSWDYYEKWGTLDMTPQEGFTHAIYTQVRGAAPIVLEDWEVLQNAGVHQLGDIVRDTQVQAEITMGEGLGVDLFNDGSDSARIHGLRFLIADDPTTGTVGDIDRSDALNIWWRNQVKTTALTSFKATWLDGWHHLEETYLDASKRSNDSPNFCVTTPLIYRFYTAGPTDRTRVGTNELLAKVGFANAAFHGAAVVYDENCPADHFYFLNTRYLRIKVLKGGNFRMYPPASPANQPWLAVSAIVLIAQLTMSNAAKQGVSTNITG